MLQRKKLRKLALVCCLLIEVRLYVSSLCLYPSYFRNVGDFILVAGVFFKLRFELSDV